jgi:hypothetical protein
VQLVVEDKQVLRRGGLSVSWFVQLGEADVEELSKYLVHREQCGRHAARTSQELPRLMPSLLPATSASSSIRASTRFCFSICSAGMYSPFEIIRDGTGEQSVSVVSSITTESGCVQQALRLHLQRFRAYYHRSPTHLSLRKNTPEPRPIHPPDAGRIIAIPDVGGLHHRYKRRAA